MSLGNSLLLKESLLYLLYSKDQPKSSQDDSIPWFVEEFKRLEEYNKGLKKEQTFTEATRLNNQQKNRYVDVLPCDEYCVTVKCCNVMEPVYINASRIANIFPQDDRVYIATQAPLKNCLKEFWHMVLQEKVGAIVMTTRLVERGVSKCDVYWPNKEGGVLNLGCIQLYLEKEVVIEEMSIVRRHIRLQHTSSDSLIEDRLVYQMEYFGWPDHGIPVQENSFLYFVEQVEKHRLGMSLVVHCSAGIGRTGVFCAVDILRRYILSDSFSQRMKSLMDKGANKETVAMLLINVVSEIVQQLRKRRPGMIQTVQQFWFLFYYLSRHFDSI